MSPFEVPPFIHPSITKDDFVRKYVRPFINKQYMPLIEGDGDDHRAPYGLPESNSKPEYLIHFIDPDNIDPSISDHFPNLQGKQNGSFFAFSTCSSATTCSDIFYHVVIGTTQILINLNTRVTIVKDLLDPVWLVWDNRSLNLQPDGLSEILN